MLPILHDDLIARVSYLCARFADTFTPVVEAVRMSAAALHKAKVLLLLTTPMLQLQHGLSLASACHLVLIFLLRIALLWQLPAWLIFGPPMMRHGTLSDEQVIFVARVAAGGAAAKLERVLGRRIRRGPCRAGSRRAVREARRVEEALDKVRAAILCKALLSSVGGTGVSNFGG